MSQLRVRFRHLQTFLEVARQKSVSTAAEMLHVSQPAVTKTIRELEAILGTKLVEKDGRGIRISRQGEVLATSGKWVESLTKAVAILGGIVLSAVALMAAVSIFGRAFLHYGLKPVPGDFELVEAGTAFVVCAFLPWCHLQRGHASVAILTDQFSKRVNAVIDFLVDFILLAAAVTMTWRHILGMLDKQKYGETTFILQYPLWWAYAGCLVGLITWIIVGLWSVSADFNALTKGTSRPTKTGAIH